MVILLKFLRLFLVFIGGGVLFNHYIANYHTLQEIQIISLFATIGIFLFNRKEIANSQ